MDQVRADLIAYLENHATNTQIDVFTDRLNQLQNIDGGIDTLSMTNILTTSIRSGQFEIVNALLDSGFDTNARPGEAIVESIQNRYIHLLPRLNVYGANFDSRSETHGMTPLECVLRNMRRNLESLNLIFVLAACGANIPTVLLSAAQELMRRHELGQTVFID